jgi:hydroxymethylbilane synthase
MTPVRIGTRGSALALWQARYIAARLQALDAGLPVSLVEIASTGDRVTDLPLAEVEGTGFFTATLQRALLDGAVDVAVHSHKDLPVVDTPGLIVAAVPERGPIEDVLCARDGLTLATLPPGARIGTCSTRRTAQVLARRSGLRLRPLRGNVPTRVGRVTRGEFDSVVLALAGLHRLGLDHHVTETFAVAEFLPAPAQGALAVECRADDRALTALLARLDDPTTHRAVVAERALLHALGGGCSVPVGAVATADGESLQLTAGVFGVDGQRTVRASGRGSDAAALGLRVAQTLLAQGAGEILAASEKAARIAAAAAEVRS